MRMGLLFFDENFLMRITLIIIIDHFELLHKSLKDATPKNRQSSLTLLAELLHKRSPNADETADRGHNHHLVIIISTEPKMGKKNFAQKS